MDEKVVITDNPYDGSGNIPHGYYHYWKEVGGDKIWLMATLTADATKDEAVEFGMLLCKAFDIPKLSGEWINENQ